MRIGFILTRPPPERISPVMPEVVALLHQWGADVEPIYPEERVTDVGALARRHDLYVLKSGGELALSVAGALHATGAAILNPYPVSAACRDKIIATRVLRAAGVPVPTTFVAGRAGLLAPALRDGALVVKPHRGSQGRGVRVIRRPAELEALADEPGPLLAQRYHPPDGLDHKIYCIGRHMFGVRRVWPAHTYEEKLGEPFALSRELQVIAERCGRAFGVGLYGFDVLCSAGRPYVVDFSSFPGFKGVPDAALRLADYIYAFGQSVTHGPRLARTGEEVAR